MEALTTVKNQYEQYSYPKPLDTLDGMKDKAPAGIPSGTLWAKIFPERAYQPEGLKILIAGCGAVQAALSALHYPQHQFIAVDISAASLEYSEKLKKKHQLGNLEHIEASLLDLDYDREFDMVVSTGVIHHLPSPKEALVAFSRYLKEDGACFGMVYGFFSRQPLGMFRTATQFLGLEQNRQSIETTQKILEKMPVYHPCRQLYELYTDRHYDAGMVDMWLHSLQHHYTARSILKLAEGTGLHLQDWYLPEILFPSALTYVPGAMRSYFKLDIASQWEVGQFMQYRDGKIFFVLRKNKSAEAFQKFNADFLKHYYACLNPINKTITLTKLSDSHVELSWHSPLSGKNTLAIHSRTVAFIQQCAGDATFGDILAALKPDEHMATDVQSLYAAGILTPLKEHKKAYINKSANDTAINIA